MESHMHIVGQCAPQDIDNGAVNLIFEALQFQYIGF
jgi:hypothetical protein